MSQHARIRLPRYLRGKSLARLDGSGRKVLAYFWELPTWAKPPAERAGRKCPVVSEALGTDLAAAIAKADRLNASLDEWRLGVEMKAVEGTVSALFATYRTLDRFKKLKAKPRKDYRRSMDTLEAVKLKTTTFGQMRVAAVKSTHADALYRHLREKAGKRSAAYCMQVARRCWNEWGRDSGAANPFTKMGLDMKPVAGNRPTSRAEYDAFRDHARADGAQSMATAAALAFELVRRVSDVFGYVTPGEEPGGIYWEDYEPGEMIALRQSKTGKRQLIPLRGEPDPDSDVEEVRTRGALLYPDLEDELARTPRGRPDMEIDGQMFTTIVVREKDGRRYTEDTARRAFRKVRDAAGLPVEMTLTGFRHGGATELGDAVVADGAEDPDLRPVTGHATKEMVDIYNKVTVSKARTLGERRLAFVLRSKTIGEASKE